MKLDKIWEIWEVSKKRWKKIWDLWETWELWCQWTPCIYETLFRIHESKKPLSSIFHMLLVCPSANLGSMSRRYPDSADVSHRVL